MKNILLLLLIILTVSCNTNKNSFTADFDNINDRVWIGKDFWSVPLEDWKVENGKLYCNASIPESRVNLLTHLLSDTDGDFQLTSKIMLAEKGDVPGSAGLLIGMHDTEDPDVRAACYFGGGIKAGISLNGFAFLKDQKTELPKDFDFSEFEISVEGNNKSLKMVVKDKNDVKTELTTVINGIQGLVALANNLRFSENDKPGNSKFSFDDLKLSGSKVIEKPDNSFGPVLWTMYTLSKGTVKLMALLPPMGEADNQKVSLLLKDGENWNTVAIESIEPDSRTAVFKIENWDATKAMDYRVEYIETGKDGSESPDVLFRNHSKRSG